MKNTALFVLLAALAVLLPAPLLAQVQTDKEIRIEFETDTETVSAFEGMRLYASYCQLCHGPSGSGDGPLAKKMHITPADLNTTVRVRSETILRKIITGQGGPTITGRERHNILSDAMPGWETIFTEDQVDSLIAYLRFLTTSEHGMMGDPEVGKRLYGKYCSVCHGVDGDGDGVMTTMLGITPADHTNPTETSALSNSELYKIIEIGRGQYMPAWQGILSEPEIEALVSYIRLLSHL